MQVPVLYRYNPALKEQGKNPFLLDSKAPSVDLEEFMNGEVRYAGLKVKHPEAAAELFARAQTEADQRYKTYVRLEKSFNED